MFSSDTTQWALKTFGQAELGDTRRTNRLVQLASALADHTGQSIVQSMSSPSEIEAAYRFVRNNAVSPDAIADAGFQSTVVQAQNYPLLLALEDTTSLQFKHKTVVDELGHITSHQKSSGMEAHSILLFAPHQQDVVGLIEQHRWNRDRTVHGQKKKRNSRPYEEKESYKWERGSRAMAERMSHQMDKVISVCDREADIIDFLTYKLGHNQRFIVRSMQSRCIEECGDKLYQFSERLSVAGSRTVKVEQKGGRPARQAQCEVRYAPVTIKMPANKKGCSVPLFYVCCQEKGSDDGLCWHILTSESVTSPEEAQQIMDYYEKRWLIEEFHKAWKTGGTQVEELRMQSKENLERIIIILAFIAVRIHQLRFLGLNKELAETRSSEELLSPLAWKVLWRTREKTKLPKSPPTLYWAYVNLAKLAGWHDSKRNGRVGWERLWQGWFKLQTILEGYQLALSLESNL